MSEKNERLYPVIQCCIRYIGGGGGAMAKNGEKWRWRIRLFHLSNSPFFANFLFWNFRFNRLLGSQSS